MAVHHLVDTQTVVARPIKAVAEVVVPVSPLARPFWRSLAEEVAVVAAVPRTTVLLAAPVVVEAIPARLELLEVAVLEVEEVAAAALRSRVLELRVAVLATVGRAAPARE